MRNGMLGAMAMAALLLGGCAQGKMAYIGADAAKKQILAEVGLDESQVKINSVDMATRNGMDYYRVEFSDENGNVYRYDIEALTGKVIESAAVEDTAGETAAQANAAGSRAGETAAQANAGAAASAGAQTASSQTVGSGTAGSGTGITAEKAKEKALVHAGLTADQVTFTKAKADRDDGRSLYEIDFYGNDGTEYEYDIDATSGEVIKYDVETPKLQVAGQQA